MTVPQTGPGQPHFLKKPSNHSNAVIGNDPGATLIGNEGSAANAIAADPGATLIGGTETSAPVSVPVSFCGSCYRAIRYLQFRRHTLSYCNRCKT